MANINERTTKDGQRAFQVIIRLKGHPTVTETFKRKTDAKKWAQQTEAEIRQGRYFPKAEARKRTVSDMIDRYIKSSLERNNKPEQRSHIKHMLEWWKSQIGVRFIADVTPSMVSKCRDELSTLPSARNKPMADATVNHYLIALSKVFNAALSDWGWLDESPMSHVKKFKLDNARDRFLTKDERSKLLQACKQSSCDYLYAVILIALTTGARKSEILEIEWKRIDFERNLLIFNKTKNGEARSVALVPAVARELKKLRAVPRIDTDLVFSRKDGLKPLEMKKHWLKAFQEAELQDFKFHDLRHTAASYLAMNGATLVELKHIMGHKTMAMVARYAHLTENHTSEIINKMSADFVN